MNRKAKKDSRYVLLLAVLQKSLYMSFFGNYFTGEFIIMWPYIITAILVIILKFEKERGL